MQLVPPRRLESLECACMPGYSIISVGCGVDALQTNTLDYGIIAVVLAWLAPGTRTLIANVSRSRWKHDSGLQVAPTRSALC